MPNHKQHLATWIMHWPTYGPYHVARLSGAAKVLAGNGIKITGFEIAPRESRYGWSKIDYPEQCEHLVVFPNTIYEEIPYQRMWGGIYSKLNSLQPDGLLINGYSSADAQALLAWARSHRKPAILMSESKEDDAPRTPIRERLKGSLVRQFSAAICGGTPHRKYLEKLGMSKEKIFLGYYAVDNEYFFDKANIVRNNPDKFRHLPGLDGEGPFFLASARFIARKNMDGLLRAYQRYRAIGANNGIRNPWRLIILGDGERRKIIEDMISDEQMEGVILAGFRQLEYLPAYYGLSTLFIHIPMQEQWGLVVNEAMACGLPVLVSDRCGCAYDLVKHGVNGYVIDPLDLQALSGLMYSMVHGDVDLKSFGDASLEIIRNWGIDRFGEAIKSAVQIAERTGLVT